MAWTFGLTDIGSTGRLSRLSRSLSEAGTEEDEVDSFDSDLDD